MDKDNEKIKTLVEIISRNANEAYQIIKNPNISENEKNQRVTEIINKVNEEAKEKELTFCNMNAVVPVRL